MVKKLALVTTSQADWGLLEKLARLIYDDSDCELQLIVTGSHLSPEFGLTIKNINMPISAEIECLVSSDTKRAVGKAFGLACISAADVFDRIKPDWLIVLGDRFEAFAVVTVAHAMNIPIAHISGGETTSGSIDDGWRHSTTKLSYLHFVYCDIYRNRVISLGEDPDRVFNFGHIGLEGIEKFYSDKKDDYYVVIWHPETIKKVVWSNANIHVLMNFINRIDSKIYFCISRGDSGSRKINEIIKEFARKNSDIDVFVDLPRETFLYFLARARAIIGNSSCGIYEAPCLKVPTINIGKRQDGRVRASTVFDCKMKMPELIRTFERIKNSNFNKCVTQIPFKSGSARKILDQIKKTEIPNDGKVFYDAL